MNAFDTPADTTIVRDAAADTASQIAALQNEIISLKSNLDSMTRNWEFASNKMRELNQKIANVRGHIFDMYSMNGEIDDDIKMIADLLDIELTKRVSGTMTIEVEYSFDAPLNFDNDDLDLSYEINCESYGVDNFDWTEVSADWSSEDED